MKATIARMIILLVAAPAFAACGEDGGTSSTATTATTATTPPAALDRALWPDPAVASPDATPRAVARSFIVDFLRMKRPPLGEFQQGDSRSGEVPVYQRREDGSVNEGRVIAIVAVRQLDGRRWFVIAALSDEAQIDAPEASAEISSPVTVSGVGRGFEGNVVVSVHAAYEPKPLVEQGVQAGSTQKEPFSADLAFTAPETPTGAVVAIADSGLDDVTRPFTAIPVRFAGR